MKVFKEQAIRLNKPVLSDREVAQDSLDYIDRKLSDARQYKLSAWKRVLAFSAAVPAELYLISIAGHPVSKAILCLFCAIAIWVAATNFRNILVINRLVSLCLENLPGYRQRILQQYKN